MGRAIVREPAVFLFDEPLSNLDAKLRVQMRFEIQKLHRRLGTTSLYVTHDQVEAMTLAQRMIVMHAGRAEQIGTPMEVYENPASVFVAGFIGSPAMNFLAATVESGGRIALDGGGVIAIVNGCIRTSRQIVQGLSPLSDTDGNLAAALTAGLEDPGFAILLRRIDESPILDGNCVRVFFSGPETFEAMRSGEAGCAGNSMTRPSTRLRSSFPN